MNAQDPFRFFAIWKLSFASHTGPQGQQGVSSHELMSYLIFVRLCGLGLSGFKVDYPVIGNACLVSRSTVWHEELCGASRRWIVANEGGGCMITGQLNHAFLDPQLQNLAIVQ